MNSYWELCDVPETRRKEILLTVPKFLTAALMSRASEGIEDAMCLFRDFDNRERAVIIAATIDSLDAPSFIILPVLERCREDAKKKPQLVNSEFGFNHTANVIADAINITAEEDAEYRRLCKEVNETALIHEGLFEVLEKCKLEIILAHTMLAIQDKVVERLIEEARKKFKKGGE